MTGRLRRAQLARKRLSDHVPLQVLVARHAIVQPYFLFQGGLLATSAFRQRDAGP